MGKRVEANSQSKHIALETLKWCSMRVSVNVSREITGRESRSQSVQALDIQK